MTKPDTAVMDFLLTRRSHPYRSLAAPAPDRQSLLKMLTAAARVPDHGKLEPWRFIVLQGKALERLAALIRKRGQVLGLEAEKIAKAADAFANAPLIVTVVSAPKPSEKIPQSEQVQSASAVCLSLLNAALASGWGANWLTGWPAHDDNFRIRGLGLGQDETIAGFIHIGSRSATPPERPRPDIGALTEWIET